MIDHSPTPWSIYTQPVADKDEAKKELAVLVDGTEFKPTLVYIASPDGLAPAVTGCGERSEANASFIVLACNAYQAIKDALNTEEDGEALVEVARNACRAEQELAAQKIAEKSP